MAGWLQMEDHGEVEMFKFSAEDIANQTFEPRFRGYDRDQVHEFLEGLARQWSEVQQSVRRLEKEVEDQARELREYRRREQSLVQALEMARQVAEEIRHQADRDAEMVLADTELKAERMLARAEKRVSQLRGELFDLRQKRTRFHSELRHMLDHYRSTLDEYEARSEEVHPLPPVPGCHEEAEEDGDDLEVVAEQEADEEQRVSAQG